MTAKRSLQIEQWPEFERRSWQCQRAGWLGMVLFVIAGSAGFLGHGMLGRVQAIGGDGTTVEYDRFARTGVLSTLTVRVRQEDSAEVLSLRIGREYLEQVLIRSIVPAPTQVAGNAHDLIFTFANSPPGSDAEIREIRFQVEPLRLGVGSISVSLVQGDALHLSQLVYP